MNFIHFFYIIFMKQVAFIIIKLYFIKILWLISIKLAFIMLLINLLLIEQIISLKTIWFINFDLKRFNYRVISQRVLKVFVKWTQFIIWFSTDSWKVHSAAIIFWVVVVTWCFNVFTFVYLRSRFQVLNIYWRILITFLKSL